MNRVKYCFCLGVLFLMSCGACSQRQTDSQSDGSREIGSYESEFTESGEVPENLYGCPMCGTSGQIRHYFTGEVMLCPACKGSGTVSEEILRELQEAERIGVELAGGNTQSADDDSNYSGNLQNEIEQCEREIENLERLLSQLEEGSVLYMYNSQELINLQYKLKQLQMMNQY